MKKSFLKKGVLFTLLSIFVIQSAMIPFVLAQNKKAESRPESRPFVSRSFLEEALTLIEIYNKIRKIMGKEDRSELKSTLDTINLILDRILEFKASFNPQKLTRVEEQLNQVKKDIAGFKDLETTPLKIQWFKLSESILRLAYILMDTSFGKEKKNP